MYAIVVDPVGDRLYFAAGDGGVGVINVDGSSRTKLTDNRTITAVSLAVDLKAG